MRNQILFGIDSTSCMVVSRYGEALAIPVLDFDCVTPVDRFAANYGLKKYLLPDLSAGYLDGIEWTPKIPARVQNQHRQFWGHDPILETVEITAIGGKGKRWTQKVTVGAHNRVEYGGYGMAGITKPADRNLSGYELKTLSGNIFPLSVPQMKSLKSSGMLDELVINADANALTASTLERLIRQAEKILRQRSQEASFAL